MTDIERIENIAKAYAHEKENELCRITPIAGAGSSRRYFRISLRTQKPCGATEESIIGTIGENKRENEAFTELAKIFARHELPTPRILAIGEDGYTYLQTDLGDMSLAQAIGAKEGKEGLIKTAEALVGMQTIPEEEWEEAVFNAPFGEEQILSDLHYFKDCFLKACGVEFDERELEREFKEIAKEAAKTEGGLGGLMMRDCQSRNIMLQEGEPYFIDFQGARKGPVLYDAISLLWQAKANLSPTLRREILGKYIYAYCKANREADTAVMEHQAPVTVLVRMLQTLGAYGLRGIIEKKAHFLQSIPAAISNLNTLLESAKASGTPSEWEEAPKKRWPELKKVAEKLKDLKILKEAEQDHTCPGRLTVTVSSFSYKKGYPIDFTGNGGGFMFDCRALHNPGRYDEYKQLTGMDEPVKSYLEKYKEVETFIENCRRVTEPSIKRYLERGFTSLQIGFGCTGGQHRSVYCAENMARIIAEKYPQVIVNVCHREQNKYYTLNAKPLRFKAMVLAAGLGTRLRPWTLEHPKALVPVGGEPMIKKVCQRLMESGAREIGVNVCHFADQLEAYMAGEEMQKLCKRYCATTMISDETGKLLETGGGIVKISSELDPEGEGILVHNADILSDADLAAIVKIHKSVNSEGVTLLVSNRESTRKLLFDHTGELRGWENKQTGETKTVKPHRGEKRDLDTATYGGMRAASGERAFSGIYMIGRRAAEEMQALYGDNPFSVTDYFLNTCREAPVIGIEQEGLRLLDIGKPEALARAETWENQ